jgi:hypothetical protein
LVSPKSPPTISSEQYRYFSFFLFLSALSLLNKKLICHWR